ncbi:MULTISPECIES: BA14K family protein [unclassified Bartonella]|uniref:BA14K family protein n=1 Tax=unclassified Bartonella TaxID=2645622 RepID=UPI0035D05B68
MKKLFRLAVLSAMSTATVLMPLNPTLADMAWYHSYDMRREAGLPAHNFSSHFSHSEHRSFDNPHKRHYVSHKWGAQQHHHVEHKTYHYVERKKTKHSSININNSGEALAMGILALAAGALLSKILKKPEQPQVVYQTAPQHQIVYQQVPQEQIIYETPQTVEYEPVQQSWESDWLQYCKKKYRSFNPKTGTFRDRNGLEHVCYAPIN